MPESEVPDVVGPSSGARLPSRWLSQGSSMLAGVVIGLAVNAVSDATKGATAPVVGGVVLLLLVTAAQLRRLSTHAPIQQLVLQFGMAGSAIVAVTSQFVPESWRPWLVLAAAALATMACVARVPGADFVIRLQGVATIGLGVASIATAVDRLLNPELQAIAASVIGFGVAGIALGAGRLLNSNRLIGVAAMGSGAAAISYGVGFAEFDHLAGVAIVGAGTAFVGVGVARLLNSYRLAGLTLAGTGVGMIGFAASLAPQANPLRAVAFIAAAVGIAVFGLGFALKLDRIADVATLVSSLALVFAGVDLLLQSDLLAGAAIVAAGVAVAGFAGRALRHGSHIAEWLRALVTEPSRSTEEQLPANRNGEPPDDEAPDLPAPRH